MAEFSHCPCANVTLLGRVAKRCQHHPTTSNNTQHFLPKSNFAQHHPTIPNITQQCPTWMAKRSQHLYPTILAFVGQTCWHRLARALNRLYFEMISDMIAAYTHCGDVQCNTHQSCGDLEHCGDLHLVPTTFSAIP